MSIRSEVLKCLEERLYNKGAEGPVFGSKEDHFAWVFGLQESELGLLQDPKAALMRSIANPRLVETHEGLAISTEEEIHIRGILQDVLKGHGQILEPIREGWLRSIDPQTRAVADVDLDY